MKINRTELIKIALNSGYKMSDLQKMSDNSLNDLVMQIISGSDNNVNLDKNKKTTSIYAGEFSQEDNKIGLKLEKKGMLTQVKSPEQVVKEPTNSEVKEHTISSISNDVAKGLELFTTQNQNQGDISKTYNSAKELFNSDLAGSRVNRALLTEQLGAELLDKADKGKLSQKDYLEAKLDLAYRLLPKGKNPSETEIGQLKQALADMRPGQLNEIITTANLATDEQYKKTWPKYTKQIIKQFVINNAKAPKDLSSVKFSLPKAGSIKSHMQTTDVYKKMTFEQTFELERGVKYNKAAVVDYTGKESRMTLLLGMSNKANQVKELLKDNTSLVDGNNKSAVPTNVLELSNKRLETSLITSLKELYGDNESVNHAVKELDESASIADGKINFGAFGDGMKSYSLVNISQKLQEKLDKNLQRALGNKKMEDYQKECTQAYKKAYGDQNVSQLASEYVKSQQEGVQAIKSGVQTAGMVALIAGQFVPVGGQVLAGALASGGLLTSTVGGVAVQATEDFSKKGGASKEDKNALIKELAVSAALVGSGMAIGECSSMAYSQMVLKNCPKLIAKAGEIGINGTMSIISTAAITGQVNLSVEGMGQLIPVIAGLLKAKGRAGVYLNQGIVKKAVAEAPAVKNIVARAASSENNVTKVAAADVKIQNPQVLPQMPKIGADKTIEEQIVIQKGKHIWSKKVPTFEGKPIARTQAELKTQLKGLKDDGKQMFDNYDSKRFADGFKTKEEIQRASVLLNAASNGSDKYTIKSFIPEIKTDKDAASVVDISKQFGFRNASDMYYSYNNKEQKMGFVLDAVKLNDEVAVANPSLKVDMDKIRSMAYHIETPHQRKMAVDLLGDEEFRTAHPDNYHDVVTSAVTGAEDEMHVEFLKQVAKKDSHSLNLAKSLMRQANTKTKMDVLGKIWDKSNRNNVEYILESMNDTEAGSKIMKILNREIKPNDVHSLEETVQCLAYAGNDMDKLAIAERVPELKQSLNSSDSYDLIFSCNDESHFNRIKDWVNDENVAKTLGQNISISDATFVSSNLTQPSQIKYAKTHLTKDILSNNFETMQFIDKARLIKNEDQANFVADISAGISSGKLKLNEDFEHRLYSSVTNKEQAEIAKSMLFRTSGKQIQDKTALSFLSENLKTDDYKLFEKALDSKHFDRYGDETILDMVKMADTPYKKDFLHDVLNHGEKVKFEYATRLDYDELQSILPRIKTEKDLLEMKSKVAIITSLKPELYEKIKPNAFKNTLSDMLKSDIPAEKIQQNKQLIESMSDKLGSVLEDSQIRELLASDFPHEKLIQNKEFLETFDEKTLKDFGDYTVSRLLNSETDVSKMAQNKAFYESLNPEINKKIRESGLSSLLMSDAPMERIAQNSNQLLSMSPKIAEKFSGADIVEIITKSENLGENKKFLQSLSPEMLAKLKNYNQIDLLKSQVGLSKLNENREFVKTLNPKVLDRFDDYNLYNLLICKTNVKKMNENMAVLESLPDEQLKVFGRDNLYKLLTTQTPVKVLKDGSDFVKTLNESQSKALGQYHLTDILTGESNLPKNKINKEVLDVLSPEALNTFYSSDLHDMLNCSQDKQVLLNNAKNINDLAKNHKEFFHDLVSSNFDGVSNRSIRNDLNYDGASNLLIRNDLNFGQIKDFAEVLKKNNIKTMPNMHNITKDGNVYDYLKQTKQAKDFDLATLEDVKKGSISNDEVFEVLDDVSGYKVERTDNLKNFIEKSRFLKNGEDAITIDDISNLKNLKPKELDAIVNEYLPMTTSPARIKEKTSINELISLVKLDERNSVYAKELFSKTNLSAYAIADEIGKWTNFDIDAKAVAKDYNCLSKLEKSGIEESSFLKMAVVNNLDDATLKSTVGVRENTAMFNSLNSLSAEVKSELNKSGFDIYGLEKRLGENLRMVNYSIPTSLEARKSFMKNFVANNNPQAEEVLKNFDFSTYGKKGIPLAYSRDKFVLDMKDATKTLSESEKSAVFDYFGIKMQGSGFDGIPKLKAENTGGKIDYKTEIIDIDKNAVAKMADEIKTRATSVKSGKITVDGKPVELEIYTGTQGGSNYGYYCKDKNSGELFYVKYPENQSRAREEVLASQLYKDAGANTPELKLFADESGRMGMISKVIPGLTPSKAAKTGFANKDFAADAWLANWDVACNDNISAIGNKAVRIDVGGALRYRAQGAEKGAAWNGDVPELISLLDGTNTDAKAIFSNINNDEFLASLQKVANVSDEQIKTSVNKYIVDDGKDELIKTLISRRDYVNEFLNIAKQTPQQNIDMAKYIEIIQRDVLEKKKFTPEMNEAVNNIAKHVKDFSLNNSAMLDDKTAKPVIDGLLNGVPEFTTIVGKQQHKMHEYSLDIHSLKVLQSSLNDPLYTSLSDKDKTILKISAIMHDLAKKGDVVDEGHASACAQYVGDILTKFNLPPEVKERIVGIVNNHHWFKDYNLGSMSSDRVAAEFRRPEDYTIARILAKADLSSVNKNMHFVKMGVNDEVSFGKAFNEKTESVLPVIEANRAKANLIFDTKIINTNKIPYDEQNGVRILNLKDSAISDNLEEYGFAPETTKDSARFTVHMVGKQDIENNLNIVKVLMGDSSNKSVWSTSVLSLENKNTYGDRKYGVLLDTDVSNIAEAYPSNIGSGYEKGMDKFARILTEDDEERTFISDNIKANLKSKGVTLSDSQYAQVAKHLLSKKYITQVKSIKIGDKVISAEDLRAALSESRDALLKGNGHNEIVAVNPRIKGLIAKSNSVDELPKEIINFAKQNNLPIILIGN